MGRNGKKDECENLRGLDMITELRPFEIEIIRKFKTFSPVTGGGKSVPRTGVWIRGHLLDVGGDGDYVYHMWGRWRDFVTEARERGARIDFGSYTAFRTYIYLLKRYGLVVPTKREKARTTRKEFYRQYYKVNHGKLDDPRWLNPYGTYESWQRRKAKGFPKRKKRVKAPKFPPPTVWPSPRELSRIWAEAERFLREHGYTITRDDLETVLPGWGVEVMVYPTFKEKVGYVIREAVEIEEVSWMARRLISPRKAPKPVRDKAHKKAVKMERLWLEK